MSASEEHIRILLRRFAGNQASETEISEMLNLLQSEEGDPALESFIMELRGEATGPLESAVDWEMVWNNIQKKTQPAIVRRLVWTRVAAAAVIVLLLSVGGYFYFNKNNQKQIAKTETQKPFKNDVAPGGNKAILTLANGKQIILDSAANGIVTQQGNTKIIKLDSGQLAYNSLNGKASEVLYNTITTPRGGQYQVVLSDGSKVWLNAASSLKYPTAFSGKERMVELTGEGYFEVVHNSRMPFRVKVNDMLVEDIGTHFNIKAYDDEPAVKTTLIQGSVKVNNANTAQILKPGEQAQLDKNGEIKVVKADVEEAVAWKNGFFHFESADLKTILRQFSRWYDVEVIYQGKMPEDNYFVIVNRSSTLASVLDALQANGIKFRIENKKLFVEAE